MMTFVSLVQSDPPMEIFLSRKCWGDDQEDQEGFKDGVAG